MFKPTFLYIKRHTITGKFYFGKTTVKDPIKYNGSGKHWSPHIKKHGIEYVETLWYCLFLDQQQCTEFALMFSKQQNIVESKEWLNLILEDGLDGAKQVFSIEAIAKIRASRLGKKTSDETKAKLSLIAKGKKRDSTIFNDQWRKLQRDSHLGRKDSIETFDRKSKAQAGANNPRAKIWKLISEDGIELEIKALKPWCKALGINPDSLNNSSKKDKFYKGYKVLSKS